jgi:hypothetical protein
MAIKAGTPYGDVSDVCMIARKFVPTLLYVMQTGDAFDTVRWCAAHVVTVRAQDGVQDAPRGTEGIGTAATQHRVAYY